MAASSSDATDPFARWAASRDEFWALLLVKRRWRDSPFALAAGIEPLWQRIAEYAHVVVTELDNAPVPLCIDGQYQQLARLRVISFVGSRGHWPPSNMGDALTLIGQHCPDLRALRVHGPGDGDFEFDRAIHHVLERCLELRILWAFDCGNTFAPTPGRTYALTHLHLGGMIYGGFEASDFEAWVRQAPNLIHFGAAFIQEVEAVEFLQAAAGAPNLQTLDLDGLNYLEEDIEDDEGQIQDSFRQMVRALPAGLQIVAPGNQEEGTDMTEDLQEIIGEERQRHEIVVRFKEDLRMELGDAYTTGSPHLWKWHDDTRAFVG